MRALWQANRTFIGCLLLLLLGISVAPLQSVTAVIQEPSVIAPETQLHLVPPNPSDSTTAEFAFSSDDPNATFLCSLDAAAFATCTSPTAYSGLADGSHTFDVSAVDAMGNVDPSPASYTWTVTTADTTPPETQITSGPADPTDSSTAVFEFSSDDPNATFLCSLDAAAFATCTSPTAYSGLADGSHTFDVSAVDAMGNVDPSPASYTWTVTTADTTPPETQITSGPADPTDSSTAVFEFSSDDPNATFLCSLDGGQAVACASPTSYEALFAGVHTFDAWAVDAASNVDPSPASYTWTIEPTWAPFIDGFETGDLSRWTVIQGLGVQQQEVLSGTYAARGTSTGLRTFARTDIGSAQYDLYYRVRFKIINQANNTVYLLRFRIGNQSLVGLYVTGAGKLGYRNDLTGRTTTSKVAVSTGAWHEVQVRALVNGAGGRVEVWYDGTKVNELSKTESLGTTPMDTIQVGENGTGKTYDMAFDDVMVDTQFIASTPIPTATATPTPTATPEPTATATPTPTPAPVSGPLTFPADADAKVLADYPTKNYGTTTDLVADYSPATESYLRFTVSGGTSGVQNAKLRLYATNGTVNGPAVYAADNTWTEAGLTWNTRPARAATAMDDKGDIPVNTWVEYDVTSLVGGDGTYSVALITPSSDAIVVSSKESSSNRPELVLTLADGSTSTEEPTPTPTATATTDTPTPTPTAAPTATETSGDGTTTLVMAAGDIACNATGGSDCKQEATSNLILNANPDAVLALGDIQYECSEIADYDTYFGPTWGRFKGKIFPTTGNHEYNTGQSYCPAGVNTRGEDYFAYFGSAAGDPSRGYYSFDVGSWHLIALNDNCSQVGGCAVGSPQEIWLRNDLATHSNSCTLAFWHTPRFTSSNAADETRVQPFWQALYDYGAEVVLTGHHHHYERFAPMDANGNQDDVSGVRQFVIGTGGKQGGQSFRTTPKVTSEARVRSIGVISMTLTSTGYSWQFLTATGAVADSGSTSCHGKPGSTAAGFAALGTLSGPGGWWPGDPLTARWSLWLDHLGLQAVGSWAVLGGLAVWRYRRGAGHALTPVEIRRTAQAQWVSRRPRPEIRLSPVRGGSRLRPRGMARVTMPRRLLVMPRTKFLHQIPQRSRRERSPVVELAVVPDGGVATTAGSRARGLLASVWRGTAPGLVSIVACSFLIAATAAPISAQEATTGPSVTPGALPEGITSEPLLRATLASLPPSPAIIAMARFTYDPGASFSNVTIPGPGLMTLESGTLSVQIYGEAEEESKEELAEEAEELAELLTPATPGTPKVEVLGPGIFAFTLHTGDQLVIPPDTRHEVRNEAGFAASLLAVAITPPAPEGGGPPWPPAGVAPQELPPGVTMQLLDVGYGADTAVPSGQAQITLTRLTLAPGAGLPAHEAIGPELLAIEAGTLGLTSGREEQRVVRGGLAEELPGTAQAGGTATPATESTLTAGGATLVQPGATGAIQNIGHDPLVVLLLTLTAVGDATATPAANLGGPDAAEPIGSPTASVTRLTPLHDAQEPAMTVVAAGDIACDSTKGPFNDRHGTAKECHQLQTAALVHDIAPTVVLGLGDFQYEDGTPAKYRESYDISWGAFKEITYPTAGGSHDSYGSGGYRDYWGERAGPSPEQTWYSFDLAAWHIGALNRYCNEADAGGCGRGSPQYERLKEDLAYSTSSCTLAFWHEPRYSSSPCHGDEERVDPLWDLLYEPGVEVILTAHNHDY